MRWQPERERERDEGGDRDGDGEEDERKKSQAEDVLSGRRLADIKSIQPLQHRDQYLHPTAPHVLTTEHPTANHRPGLRARRDHGQGSPL